MCALPQVYADCCSTLIIRFLMSSHAGDDVPEARSEVCNEEAQSFIDGESDVGGTLQRVRWHVLQRTA